MFGITSKEKVFFELFVETANTACKCADMLAELVSNYENVEDKNQCD